MGNRSGYWRNSINELPPVRKRGPISCAGVPDVNTATMCAGTSCAAPINTSFDNMTSAVLSPHGVTADDDMPAGVMVAGAVLGVVIIVVGVFGNVLVILAVLLSRNLYKSSNMFVVSLAVCDLVQTVLIKPLYVHTYVVGEWQFGVGTCFYALYASNLAILESILHVSAIALHRYLVIVHPRVGRVLQGPRAVAAMLGVVYVAPLLVVVAPTLSRLGGAASAAGRTVSFNKRIMFCSFVRYPEFRIAGVLKKVSFLSVAAVFIFYCYVRIYLLVRRSGQSVNARGTFSSARLQREITLLKTVIVIFMTFAVSYLPISILYAVDTGRNFPYAFYFCGVLLLWTSSSVNWMIYGLMNKQYLQAYHYILCGTGLTQGAASENGSTSKVSFNMSFRECPTEARRFGRMARYSVCRDNQPLQT